jgi:hypothetical protein
MNGYVQRIKPMNLTMNEVEKYIQQFEPDVQA